MIANPGRPRKWSCCSSCSRGARSANRRFLGARLRSDLHVRPDGKRRGSGLRFNSLGERFKPFDSDAEMSARVFKSLGIERVASKMVLEGGAISVDGQGTALTTEQCLLNPNRNPGCSREQMEDELSRCLGIDKLIWLPWGQAEDAHTDGHVDGACLFVDRGWCWRRPVRTGKPELRVDGGEPRSPEELQRRDGKKLEVIEFLICLTSTSTASRWSSRT